MGKERSEGEPRKLGKFVEHFLPKGETISDILGASGKNQKDPQAPPGLEDELSLDVHGKAETVMAEEGGSQVLGDEVDTSNSETAICSETALEMDFLDLPEAGEEDQSLKQASDENLTSAPEIGEEQSKEQA